MSSGNLAPRRTSVQIAKWAAAWLLLVGMAAPTVQEAGASSDFSLQIAAGLREDRLDWALSGSIQDEDTGEIFPVRSELLWDDLKIRQVRTRGTLTVAVEDFSRFAPRFRAEAGYGRIHSGRNQDADFALVDGEVIEFSRSNNDADRGHVLDLSLAAGPHFRVSPGLAVTPLLGYSYHEQNLRITDGVQTIPPEGPFSGLDSRYETEWRGPWLGLELAYLPVQRLTISGNVQYHWADFEAVADWNLRTDFQHPVSFSQSANATGVDLSAAVAYELAPRWDLELSYDYRRWQTASGIHRFFFVDFGTAAVPLHEVTWKSQALMVGLSHHF